MATATTLAPLTGYTTPATVEASTPGMSNLGWGVNAATGNLLSGYLQPIVDQEKLAALVESADLNQTTTSCIAAEDGYNYLTEETASVGISGGYAGFSGTLNSSFGLTESEEYTASLATYTQLVQLYQLTIPIASLPEILSAGFKADLYGMSPQEFYTKYGAYFTSTVVVGGSLSSSIQTQETSSYSQSTMSVSASAAYSQGIASGSVDASYQYTNTQTQTTYTCNTGIAVIGGTPMYKTDSSFDEIAWSQTVPANPAVVGYGAGGLTPMWQLVTDDAQRQAELKGALDAYFSQPNSYLLAPLTLNLFSATSPTTTGTSVDVQADSGYKILGGGASLQQDAADNQFLTTSIVIDSEPPNQWNSAAKSVHKATNATLTSHVIAVYDPGDLLDVDVASATSAGSYKSVGAACSVEAGYIMTGGGAQGNPNSGYGLMLSASYPSSETQWSGLASMHDDDCTGSITVSAIGIKWKSPAGKPRLATQIVHIQSPISNIPTQTVGVPANCALVGGGAIDNTSGYKGNMLQNSFPASDVQWVANGHDAHDPYSCTITTYAIGLQVVWVSAQDGSTKTVAFGPGCLTAPPGYVAPAS